MENNNIFSLGDTTEQEVEEKTQDILEEIRKRRVPTKDHPEPTMTMSVIEQAIEAGKRKLGPDWCHEVPYEPLDDPEEIEQRSELRHLHDDFIDPEAQKEWNAVGEVPEDVLESKEFNAIFDVIKKWDVGIPNVYWGYCGGNGSHAYMIYKALQEIKNVELEKRDTLIKSPGVNVVVQDESIFVEEEKEEAKGYVGSDDQEAITSFAPYLPLD